MKIDKNSSGVLRPQRLIFARVGWMQHYRWVGEPIVRGGAWKKKGEVFNFRPVKGRVYGYVQPTGRTINLERVAGESVDETLDDVLVIFFASHPHGLGQVIVGWYRNATVHRARPQMRKWLLKERKGRWFNLEARLEDAVLLPPQARVCSVPRQKGATGYSMVTYARDAQGRQRLAPWIENALEFIHTYDGENFVETISEEASDAAELAVERVVGASAGQGFALSSGERTSIEERAMLLAEQHYQRQGYLVTRVGRPYDLRCRRPSLGNEILYVEVKGTRGQGETIILTANEVEHARRHRAAMELFLVHSIRLDGRVAGKRVAAGGVVNIHKRWAPQPSNLGPIAYYYRVP